jgi:hypothetical protein
MKLEMKLIKDLNMVYADDNIKALVDFTQKAPILLPEHEEYHVEMKDGSIHVYSRNGIVDYKFDEFNNRLMSDLDRTGQGLEMIIDLGDTSKRVILHSQPYNNMDVVRAALTDLSPNRNNGGSYTGTFGNGWTPTGESKSGESRSSGESRPSSESRSSSSSGESRSGGESR